MAFTARRITIDSADPARPVKGRVVVTDDETRRRPGEWFLVLGPAE
ncbi:hypothetical protein [Plantactinospora mayteni]|nr:hypothetical protein [Plantactinospora mayteni]